MQIEEIVVTAQKREENLQRVPIAVSAVTSTMLSSHGITSVQDLGQAVPGLIVVPQLNSFSPIIRGIGQSNLAPGSDPGVATYVDGVYYSSPSGSALGLGDVSRVEVLRGPQGTLFGRNANGGVVNIVTSDPSRELSGDVSVSASYPETYGAKLYVTGPFTEHVSGNLSVVEDDQVKGFGHNVFTGRQAYYLDETTVRSKILIDLPDNTTLKIGADYDRTKTDFGISQRDVVANQRIDGLTGPSNFWNTLVGSDPGATTKQGGLSLTLDHDFGLFSSKTIVAYRDTSSKVYIDQGYVTFPVEAFDPNVLFDRTSTFETQLLSAKGGKLDWITGLFFLHSKAGSDATVSAPSQGVKFTTDNTLLTNSIAPYGQLTYHITDTTGLTLGARYTDDARRLISNDTLGIPQTNRTASWRDPTFRLAVDHQFTQNWLTYVSFNRGFKSGVFNTFDYPVATSPPVNPETINAFELGSKLEAFDHRLRFNTAIYYNKYDNIQLSHVINGNAVLTNAARATTYGGELEAQLVVTDDLMLDSNFAYTHATYSSFPNAPVFVPNANFALCNPRTNPINCEVSFNAKGESFDGVPKTTFNIGAHYTHQMSTGKVGGDLAYFREAERPFGFNGGYIEPAYGLLSADTFLRFGDRERQEVKIFGRNLQNTQYALSESAGALNNLRAPAPGRVVGAEYSFHF